jgi:hypothetical protein
MAGKTAARCKKKMPDTTTQEELPDSSWSGDIYYYIYGNYI